MEQEQDTQVIQQDTELQAPELEQVEETPAEKVRRAFEAVKDIAGITIELCGAWLWITGDTYPHRETFKNAGFRFSRQKTAWYFAGVPCSSKESHSFSYIRSKYGRKLIKGEDQQ